MTSDLGSLSDDQLSDLLQRARALTLQRFGRTIQMYAPLYLSNECIDTCTYCGFSLDNKIARKTLTTDEVVSEAELLMQKRFRHLLFVAGEHPAHVSVDYLEKVIQKIRLRLASISIEVAPFREADYRRLIQAGLDGVVLYQETYSPKQYAAVHIAGPKKNYEKRLKAPEEAARAGIRFLGLGVLLGLSDWREEVIHLIRHVKSLRKKFPDLEMTVSLPRLRPCASTFTPTSPVTDRDFIQMIAVLRMALPDVGIVLSTRESPALRDFLVGLGITQMSAGSVTEPGGYSHPEENLKQFEIEDRRTPGEVALAIRQQGYEAIWKDWTSPLGKI